MQTLKEDIRLAILKAATALFLEKGYTQASMKDVAREVGISVGNVYRYFPNKETLFAAVTLPAVQALSDMTDHHGKAQEDANDVQLLAEISRVLTQLVLEHREPLLILYYGSQGTPMEQAKVEFIHQFTEHIHGHLQIVSGDERIAKPLAVAFLEGLFCIIKEFSDPLIVKTVAHEYVTTWFQGLQKLL